MENSKYIPALGYDILTPFYDIVVATTTRENLFKTALVEKAGIKANHRVLDLACGSATLTILLKSHAPEAEVIGVDGDPKILKLAGKKLQSTKFKIRFDEAMSYALPYPDKYFDRVLSSLFFHHLTREKKVETLREVSRILKPGGELHIADWGLPANYVMTVLSRFIQMLDGFETTSDNFQGLLPKLIEEAGFKQIEETAYYNTVFGTIRLHKSRKP